ncbi:RNA-directed DNA methylation 4-like [Papaver somniferum]|uniref:RNA-directed DNA methylation 4-like n=1 Tax=Papaver somniferum TaxID=3469 RepID=UPI000E6FFABD|nr:RNA-directed DNA methylation 4-like [Papaver somniferum]
MTDIGETSISSSSSTTTDEKPLIVRVKRKSSQSRCQFLGLKINERPLKRPLVDFEKLSISDSSQTEILKCKKVLVQHVETVSSTKAAIGVLQSIVVSIMIFLVLILKQIDCGNYVTHLIYTYDILPFSWEKLLKNDLVLEISKELNLFEQPNSDYATDFKTKVEERRQTFKQENKQVQRLSRARENHEDMAKNARFEQIWKRRKGKVQGGSIHELCHIYDVVRVDVEEETPKKEEQPEDSSLEDNKILCNFLPLMREFLPDVAAEIQSDMQSYINSEAMDDYVYDLNTVKDERNATEEEDTLNTYPLVQVGEDDDYCDGPKESEWDTSVKCSSANSSPDNNQCYRTT